MEASTIADNHVSMTQPTLVHEPPNIENTIPLSVFRAQYPERFSLIDEDKFVLHAGGPSYRIQVIDAGNVQLNDQMKAIVSNNVAVYVLNTCLVLWSSSAQIGLLWPYPQIALHALKELHDHVVLYLQVMTSPFIEVSDLDPEYQATVELVLEETESNEPVILLFHEKSTILEVYDALAECSALHYDPVGDFEDHQWITTETDPSQIPHIDVTVNYLDSGHADDLGHLDGSMADDSDSDGAGMEVGLGTRQLAGSVRERDSELEKRTAKRTRT